MRIKTFATIIMNCRLEIDDLPLDLSKADLKEIAYKEYNDRMKLIRDGMKAKEFTLEVTNVDIMPMEKTNGDS